jgi:hypothetical protein
MLSIFKATALSVSPIRYNDTFRSSFEIGCPALCMKSQKVARTPLNRELASSVLLTSLNFDNKENR